MTNAARVQVTSLDHPLGEQEGRGKGKEPDGELRRRLVTPELNTGRPQAKAALLGDLVMIEGSLRNDTWEKDGVKRSTMKVRVNNFARIQ